MAARVGRHRSERPSEWSTIEETVDIAGAFERAGGALVIVDCLTLWTSNLMWLGRSDADIDELAATTAEQAAGYGRPVLAITNEVGLGVQQQEFARFQSDAPSCDNCGALTVRCGTCYRCFNCGNSMGCS